MAKQKKQRKTRPIKSKKARVKKKQVKRTQDLRRQELVKAGISPAIIERGDLTNKQLSKAAVKDWRTRGQKLDELNKRGYKNVTISDLRLSWPRLKEKYPEISIPADYKPRGTAGNKKKPGFNPTVRLSGNAYLYIGAAEVVAGFAAVDFTDVDDSRLIDMILTRVQDAAAEPDGSDDLYCVFKVHVGSRSDCEAMADYYYQRGYNMSADHIKTNPNRYSRICISNSFSQREFYEMIYTCISQMKNDDVPLFMSSMREFCDKNGFPFMKNLK